MLGRDMVSIDFGSKNIKIVQGKQQGSTVSIEKAVVIPTPPNSIKDGKIMNEGPLAAAIGDALIMNKIKAKRAVATIKNTAIITRELVLPSVRKEQLDSMIKIEIARYLPITLNEYITEYRLMEEFTEDRVKKVKLLVVALPTLIAEGYYHLLKKLKLKPVALDVHVNAVSKLFDEGVRINEENYNSEQTVAFIDLGHTYIHLNIMSGNTILFNRLIAIGASDIDINLINSFNLSPEEAEKIKMEQGNLHISADITPDEAMVNDVIKLGVDNWIKELQKLFQYHTSRDTGNRIDKIYIFGAGAKLNGLSEYMRFHFNIPTDKISELSNVKMKKSIENVPIEDCIDAIGAMIRR